MAARNRAFDTVAGGFVFWETEFPDTTGAEYPGPGTFGSDTSDYCVSGGRVKVEGPASLLTETFDPVALYKLNGNLIESVGTGPNTFTVAGVEQYTAGPITGSQAVLFNGSTGFTSTADQFSSAINNGSITVQGIVRIPTNPPGSVEVMGTSQSSSNGWYFMTFFSTSVYCGYLTGGAREAFFSRNLINDGNWHHVVYVRDVSGGGGNVTVKIWVDTVLVATYSGGPLPTGTSPILRIGRNPTSVDYAPANSEMSSFKIIPRVLSHTEIIAEYKRWQPELER